MSRIPTSKALLSDLPADATLADVAAVLEREGWAMTECPPGAGGPRWGIILTDTRTLQVGYGASPNLRNAIILAEASLLRAIEQYAQESATIPRAEA